MVNGQDPADDECFKKAFRAERETDKWTDEIACAAENFFHSRKGSQRGDFWNSVQQFKRAPPDYIFAYPMNMQR